ncbi:hypothetical protein J2847_005815 [Azospirillum agricola]|uniref:hypothetical protein n=1 Tax=Azospirillum agricola TaxID=1720247 RepID=UPI001AE1AB5F|nr:hypothetical protein [Azospirillum agricola]MBP2232486.1 hypothetical protein [Azospirillum agricola]
MMTANHDGSALPMHRTNRIGADGANVCDIRPVTLGFDRPMEMLQTSAPCQAHTALSVGAVTQVPGLARRCMAFIGDFLTMLVALFVLDWLIFLLG